MIPLLRGVHLKKNVSNILRWECVLVDAAGAMLALLVFGFVITSVGNKSFVYELASFIEFLIVGLLSGFGFGFVLGFVFADEMVARVSSEYGEFNYGYRMLYHRKLS